MNVEEILKELVKYSRTTKDGMKVEKMTHVVAEQIEREIKSRQLAAIGAQMALLMELNEEGHA